MTFTYNICHHSQRLNAWPLNLVEKNDYTLYTVIQSQPIIYGKFVDFYDLCMVSLLTFMIITLKVILIMNYD